MFVYFIYFLSYLSDKYKITQELCSVLYHIVCNIWLWLNEIFCELEQSKFFSKYSAHQMLKGNSLSRLLKTKTDFW